MPKTSKTVRLQHSNIRLRLLCKDFSLLTKLIDIFIIIFSLLVEIA